MRAISSQKQKEKNKIKKMAAEHRICVSVLEGAFVGLHEVDVPLPVCMHLQDKGARFESAQWTAKQTKSGFSIYFPGQLMRWLWQSPESRGDTGGDLQRLIEERNRQHL